MTARKARQRDLAALLDFLEQRAAEPFSYGRKGNDCVAFASGATKAQIHIDPLGDMRWATMREARVLLKAEGGMRAALDRRFRRVPPAMAQRGDIAGVACRRFGTRLMVVEGDTLVGPGEHGIRRMRREAMVVAWDVSSYKPGRAAARPSRSKVAK